MINFELGEWRCYNNYINLYQSLTTPKFGCFHFDFHNATDNSDIGLRQVEMTKLGGSGVVKSFVVNNLNIFDVEMSICVFASKIISGSRSLMQGR